MRGRSKRGTTALQKRKLDHLQLAKSGLHQQLLPVGNQVVPRIRFAGFGGEWEKGPLGAATKIAKGSQRGKADILLGPDDDNPYPVFNGGRVPSGYTDEFNRENKVMVSEGGASAGFVNFYPGKYWSGGHNFTIDNLNHNLIFVKAILESRQNGLYDLRVGSGLPNIQLGSISAFEVPFPAKEEQAMFATLFFAMDLIVEHQASKLAALTELKSTLLRHMFI